MSCLIGLELCGSRWHCRVVEFVRDFAVDAVIGGGGRF